MLGFECLMVVIVLLGLWGGNFYLTYRKIDNEIEVVILSLFLSFLEIIIASFILVVMTWIRKGFGL